MVLVCPQRLNIDRTFLGGKLGESRVRTEEVQIKSRIKCVLTKAYVETASRTRLE
jgi:hypothetical protein